MPPTVKDNPSPPAGPSPVSRAALRGALVMVGLVVLAWVFPRAWYTRAAGDATLVWFDERTNVAGWNFRNVPVDATAESLLVADRTFNGEFTAATGRDAVRAFSAKRYTHKSNDTGLFLHTPDRCWTLAGWKFEQVTPDFIELTVHGVRMTFERRVFVAGGHRELVYFGGLVGGRPLPYRLDHNLSVGRRFAVSDPSKNSSRGFFARAVDMQLWGRVWDGFLSRRPLLGPKQFLRISTLLDGRDMQAADQLLKSFLEAWLEPTDYGVELAAWQKRTS